MDEEDRAAAVRRATFGGHLSREQFLKQSLVLGVSASAMSTLLAACGNGSTSTGVSTASNVGTKLGKPSAQPTGTLRWAQIAAPSSLDQTLVGDSGSTNLASSVSETLTRVKDDGTVYPWLLESYTLSDDGIEFVGHVRQGVKFHDGTIFDSHAIRKTFEYNLSQPGAFGSVLLSGGPRLIDDSDPAVIRMVFKKPAVDIVSYLSYLYMMSPKQIALGKSALQKRQVGTGPFRFVSASATMLRLESNPDYWGDAPHVAQIEMPVMPDVSAQVNALETAAIDLDSEVSPSTAAQLKSAPKLQVLTNPNTFRVSYFVCKTAVAPMDDLNMRRAVAYALDRATIAKSVLRGLADPADTFEPRLSDGYAPMKPGYPYDPAQAKRLVAAYPGGTPHIKMANVTGATDALAQAIAQQLRDVGFKVDLDGLDETVFNAETGEEKSRHSLYLTQYGWISPAPLIYSGNYFVTIANFDKTGPKDVVTRLNKLIDKLNATPNGPERDGVIASIRTIHAEYLPHIPLFFQSVTDAASERVQGYAVAATELPDLRPVYLAA